MSSNNTLTSKRRRLNNLSSSHSALSKPFKSPLRKPAEAQSQPEAQTHEASHITTNNTTTSTTTTGPISISNPSSTPQPSTPITPRPRKYPTKATTPIHSPTPSSLKTTQATAHINTLQKQHTLAQSRLISLRQELDTVSQALRIEEKGTDTELEALVGKWRDASRAAAEELFVGAREKVDRMGGVGAWNERVRSDRVKRLEGNEAFNSNVVGDGREGDGGNEEESKGEDEEDEKEDEDEAFTIDLMLKHMNIDLDIIGYDKENQRWTD